MAERRPRSSWLRGGLLAACMASSLALAGPACVDPGGIGGTGHEGGVGGTGAPVERNGVGGTGAPTAHNGVGGTGAPARGGVGGTGSPAQTAKTPGGIGGTGVPVAEDGGVGGTGAPVAGGTGIVGTITGFASICVNGLEVFYDENTPTNANGEPLGTGGLAIGQVVAIDARPGKRGLEARQIDVLHVLDGPVTGIDPGRGQMRVMGQTVKMGPGTIRGGQIRVGQTVQVSGMRDSKGQVVASRIDAGRPGAPASAIGTLVAARDLQGLALTGIGGAGTPAGGEVLVRGRWNGSAIAVDQVRVDPSLPFKGQADRAVVEGLVRHTPDNAVRVGGFEVSLPARSEAPVDDVRVRVSGRLIEDRRIAVERIEVVRPMRDDASRPVESSRGRDARRDARRADREAGAVLSRGDDKQTGGARASSRACS